MFYMNNNTNNENGLSAPTLTEAVETIAACSNELMVVAEIITQSCKLVETWMKHIRKYSFAGLTH
ncbi:MAG: hypothetical protein ACUZ8I_08450 [Candidatus Scalindua sp.]